MQLASSRNQRRTCSSEPLKISSYVESTGVAGMTSFNSPLCFSKKYSRYARRERRAVRGAFHACRLSCRGKIEQSHFCRTLLLDRVDAPRHEGNDDSSNIMNAIGPYHHRCKASSNRFNGIWKSWRPIAGSVHGLRCCHLHHHHQWPWRKRYVFELVNLLAAGSSHTLPDCYRACARFKHVDPVRKIRKLEVSPGVFDWWTRGILYDLYIDMLINRQRVAET